MRATSGKSLFTETLYVAQIIRYVIVYGNSLRSPKTPYGCCTDAIHMELYRAVWRLYGCTEALQSLCGGCELPSR